MIRKNLRNISSADLAEKLRQHKLWLETGGRLGNRADLNYTDLHDAYLGAADLSRAELRSADLHDAHLGSAELNHADLTYTDLHGANLDHADLKGAILTGTDLTGADLNSAQLGGADLGSANMRGAKLPGADLEQARLSDADLFGAQLNDANLGGADLSGANLDGAYLRLTNLGGAYLSAAVISRTVFEPKNLPVIQEMAQARGLELMTYEDNPTPVTQLRKQFQDAGYREQERAITCALNRRQAELDSFVERWFKRTAFDWTCEYAFKPGRPLWVVLALWLLFSFIYAGLMHLPGTSGIYFVGTRVWRGKTNTQGIQIRPERIPAAKGWKLPLLWIWREWRVLRAAMFFSLMSAFNIGFRDINFGRWLRGLTKHEYDLKAVGWARTVSGFQSLLSVYLIALWVLSYFGRPFG